MTRAVVSGKDARGTLFSGTAGGLVAGLLLGVVTWFYDGSIGEGGLSFARTAGIGGLVTTISHFSVFHAIFGAVVGLVIVLVAYAVRRTPPRLVPASIVFAISVALYAFAYLFVGRNLALPAYVPLGDSMRTELLRSSLTAGVVAAVVAFAVAAPFFSLLRLKRFRTVLTALLVCVAVISLVRVVGWNLSDARYTEARPDYAPSSQGTGKVMLIGLDGATWQLLDEFSAEGLLPNIDRLRATGVSANLVTHGRRVSPAVWTGIATGWSHAKHGVVGFTVPEPLTGRSRVVGSMDRKKPAVWQILSELGRTSVVVNWWATYPAEKINGAVVSRIVDIDAPAVHPRELLPRVTAIVDSSRLVSEGKGKLFGEVEALFNLTEGLIRDGQPDLLMLYVQGTDKMQHAYWAAYEPGKYGDAWSVTPEYVAEGRKALRNLWADVDRRVGELVALADPGTTVLVVSDHGFKPRSVPLVLPNMNELLHAMGYVQWSGPDARNIDFARSQAFTAVLDAGNPVIGLCVNIAGRQVEGSVPPETAPAIAARLVDELSALRIEETGEPLFRRVGLVADSGPQKFKELGFDVYAEKGSPLRFPGKGRTVRVGGEGRELDEFLVIRSGNTGNHHPKGVLLGVGPAFRSGVVLPLVADSPYTAALTYVTGYVPKLEGFYRAIRALGFLDPYTSIDTAPSVLYMLGLPCSSDMEGRPFERVLARDLLRSTPISFVPSFDHLRPPEVEDQGTLSEETLEQLRALGYIQ